MPSGTAYAGQHLARAWELDMLGNWGRYLADIEEDGDASDAAAVGSNQVRSHNRANEIEDPNPSAQYDAANQNASGTITSRYYRFAYDDAGNMTDERSGTAIPIPPTVMAGEVMTYDAWNRLVATEHRPSTGSAVDISEHSYNALGWRVSKRMDSSKGAYDGLDQERVFLYDASWRMIEEWVDTNLDGTTDYVSQQFWGLRYIDDAVAKRVNRNLADDWVGNAAATTWYQITDAQFSVVAVLDSSGDVYERIEYDAYGNARHRYSGDTDGDGRFFAINDLSILGGEYSIGDANYHADFDVNLDGHAYYTTSPSDLALVNAMGPRAAALPGGWIGDPSSTSGPDNSIGYCGYVHNPEREDYTVRFRVYSPQLGRWRQRDPIKYEGGKNLFEYSTSRPLWGNDPTGLKLVVNGDEGYRDTVENALKELCPGSSIDEDGTVSVDCGSDSSPGCDCLNELANNNKSNTISNDGSNEFPNTSPDSPGGHSEPSLSDPGDPLSPFVYSPGLGTGTSVHFNPNQTWSEDKAKPIPDSVILGHELCGHALPLNNGTHVKPSENLLDTRRPEEDYALEIENKIRKQLRLPPRPGTVHPFIW